jgi:hypothetical protein
MTQTGNYKLLCFGMGNANTTSCSLAREMLLAYKNKSTLCVDMIERLNILDGVADARAFSKQGWRANPRIDL